MKPLTTHLANFDAWVREKLRNILKKATNVAIRSGLLHYFRPFMFRGFLFVLRRPDVRQVLTHSEDFVVSNYASAMKIALGGDFFLGRDAHTDAYQYESQLARCAVSHPDMDRFQLHIAEIAPQRLQEQIAKQGARRFNLLPYTLDVVTSACEFLFGIHSYRPSDYEELLSQKSQADDAPMHSLFADLSTTSKHIFGGAQKLSIDQHHELLDAGRRVREQISKDMALGSGAFLSALAKIRKSKQESGELDFDEMIGRSLAGIVSGLTVPTVNQFLIAMRVVLRKVGTRKLRKRLSAADSLEQKREILWRHLREASRFEPFPIGLFRITARDTILAAETGRPRAVKSGQAVLAHTLGANFDPDWVPDPRIFDPQRPTDNYQLFGYGPHLCYGQDSARPIARILMTEMALCLFHYEVGLARNWATGPWRSRGLRKGKIGYRAPHEPGWFWLTLDEPV